MFWNLWGKGNTFQKEFFKLFHVLVVYGMMRGGIQNWTYLKWEPPPWRLTLGTRSAAQKHWWAATVPEVEPRWLTRGRCRQLQGSPYEVSNGQPNILLTRWPICVRNSQMLLIIIKLNGTVNGNHISWTWQAVLSVYYRIFCLSFIRNIWCSNDKLCCVFMAELLFLIPAVVSKVTCWSCCLRYLSWWGNFSLLVLLN